MKEFLGDINEYLEYRQKESIREISAERSKLHQEQENKESRGKVQEAKPTTDSQQPTTIISKEQKNIQNKLKKVEEKISDLELKIEEFEASFAKENPSEQVLESYNKTKEELDLTLQEWEYLGSQLEA